MPVEAESPALLGWIGSLLTEAEQRLLLEEYAADWLPQKGENVGAPLAGAELPWRTWLQTHFPHVCRHPMGARHERLWEWFEALELDRRPRPRVEVWPRGGGKAIGVNTPIPTPTGWTTMGAIQPGDYVLDHRGRPTKVTVVSPVSIQPAYRVSFDDGTSVIAAHDHLWAVLDRSSRRSLPADADWATDVWSESDGRPMCRIEGCGQRSRKGTLCSAHAERKRRGAPMEVRFRWQSPPGMPRQALIRTTEELLGAGLRGNPAGRDGHSERLWAIPLASAYEGRPVNLPIAPYILGAWLGDGTTCQAAISAGSQDVDAMQSRLESCGAVVRRLARPNGNFVLSILGGFRASLRKAGVLGNKHIPAPYLRASREQRMELLRGMLDTDGWVGAHSCSAELVTVRENLARELEELAVSLGYRVTISRGRAKLAGRDCGPTWRLRIAGVGPEVFALARKSELLSRRSRRRQRNTGRVRYIEKIEPVPDQPVRCIVVDSPGHLFLVGEGWVPTHNSTTLELAVTRCCVKLTRRYALVVSGTQAQADKHVQAIATLMERAGVGRALNVYGNSKGWRRQELRTANGFNVSAYGLDAALRGVKLDEFRPDLIAFDDLDEELDTARTVERKISTLTTAIIPAESGDCAHLFLQNLVHEDGIFAQLLDGRADFLLDREPAAMEPAVRGLELETHDRGDGQQVYRIAAGEASWEGQALPICQDQINRWGKRAFLREAQHEVQGGAGYVFDVTQLRPISPEEVPELAEVCLAWDLAATEGGGDWTAGVLLGRARNGLLYVLAVIRGQWSAERVRACMRLATAYYEGLEAPPGMPVGPSRDERGGRALRRWPLLQRHVPQDPGQAGKDQAGQLRKADPALVSETVTGKKGTRATGFAEQVNLGNVSLVQADLPEFLLGSGAESGLEVGTRKPLAETLAWQTWHRSFTDELRKFREEDPHRRDTLDQVDDQVDAGADAFNVLARKRRHGFS